MTRARDPAVPQIVRSAVGVLMTLVLWEVIGHFHLFGAVWPPLTTVVHAAAVEPSGRVVLLRATAATLPEAAVGLATGVLLGTLLALTARLVPLLSRGLAEIAVLVQAVPVIAIAPLLLTTLDRGMIPSTLAAVGAMSAAFISVTAGLASPSVPHRELFRVLGATDLARLRHLDGPACLPYFLEGLRFAVPGAIVGAIVGEWFLATRGLGVVMVQTMRSGDLEMLLGAALVAALVSLAAYGVVATVERRCRWEQA
jgi:ABC-type nitrate/sulfonate/bicarbonate transport system permease component